MALVEQEIRTLVGRLAEYSLRAEEMSAEVARELNWAYGLADGPLRQSGGGCHGIVLSLNKAIEDAEREGLSREFISEIQGALSLACTISDRLGR